MITLPRTRQHVASGPALSLYSMIPLHVLLLSFPLGCFAALEKTFGVPPSLLPRYVPVKSSWKCLDGSKQIPWDFVNDDSCDCPDGSDEPGTSACANKNSAFYCHNVGHIGATIRSSRVNDGLCELECCDGSDELPGVCPNTCKEVGEAYRKKRNEEMKIRKTGSKIRSTYIIFAQKEKKRLESLVESTSQEIVVRRNEVARLKDIVDRAESISAAALEHKKESPLYISLMEHYTALKSLQREHKKLQDRSKELSTILDTLRTGYNPNYQDMAVLEAVRGWEQIAGLEHINDVGKDKEEEKEEEEKQAQPAVQEEDDGMWTAEELEQDLDELLNTDYVSLLLEHDEHVRTPVKGTLLFDLASYLPDTVLPQYEEIKNTVLSWFRLLGVIRGDDTSASESSRARQAFTDAENALKKAEENKKNAEDDLDDLFSVEGFGKDGEWKKLDGLCLEKDTGEYTYEVCLFGEARQKPNKGGSTFSLGHFDGWNSSPDVTPGEPEYYKKQYYKHGARCWNGPERSVVLELSCGTENALLTVVELEKCEYGITGTTPALCLPISESEGKDNNREEL
ncbi:hypothetical protein E1B28_003983 [Marasmius oreades]|uniref:Glucosidase 2 subunit beta n=1 Tax=Marasmius oreades TaxID=181124 RepID=A0A9P7UXM6_9AGAR|nr:uncharacterized protein E1B28_003983 [Marasmius oreades]KAG7096561.1 hypothetical protein E1B28_003983 [Marasmius oreades]